MKEVKPKKKAEAYIYYLFDPRDGIPTYVGKTCSPKNRLSQHKQTPKRARGKVANWVRGLKEYGVKPEMMLIACSLGNWQELEKILIAQYRAEYTLLNTVSGGNQPQLEDEGTKKILRDLHRNLGASISRGHISEYTKAKLKCYAVIYPDILGRYANIKMGRAAK